MPWVDNYALPRRLILRKSSYLWLIRIQRRAPGRRVGGLSTCLFQKFLCKLFRCCLLFNGIGEHIILYAVPLAQRKQPCRSFKKLAAVFAAGAVFFLCVTGSSPTNIVEQEALAECNADSGGLTRPIRFGVNLLLTLSVIALLAWNRFPGYYPVMLGTVAALLVNYGFDAACHKRIIQIHAAPALTMCSTMMGTAVLMGILTSSIGPDGLLLSSGVIELPPGAVPSVLRCLANLISIALPAALGKHLHLLLCMLTLPMALFFDTDSYFYGMLPVMLGIGLAFGLDALPIAITMLILRISTTFLCPMAPAVLLGTGMADVTIRSHIRASALYAWGFSSLCLLFAVVIGLVPL